MRNIFRIISLVLLSFLTSCDCNQVAIGVVVDANTEMPIWGVKVSKKNGAGEALTDSTGVFEISAISGGFRCPPMKVIVEKEGYKTQELSVSSEGALVKLEPEK